MDENKTNNSQEQENKKNKKGIKAWWFNLGKGVRTTICVLGGVAVVTAITVPTAIAAKGCAGDKSKTKTTEITGTGSDLIKAVTLAKQSDGSYKGSIEVADGKSIDDIGSIIIKAGNKVLVKNTDYTLNSSNGELIIKANVISANDNITIEVVKFTGEVSEAFWNEAFTSISDSNTRNYSGTKVEDGGTTTFAVNNNDDSVTTGGTTKYETVKNDLRYTIINNGGVSEINDLKVKTVKSIFDKDVVDEVKDCMNGKYSNYTFDASTKSYKGSLSNDTNVEIKFGSRNKVSNIVSSVASSTTTFTFKDYGTTTVNVPTAVNEFGTDYDAGYGYSSDRFDTLGTHKNYYFNLDLKNKTFIPNSPIYIAIYDNTVNYLFNTIDSVKLFVDGQSVDPTIVHTNKDYYCYNTDSFSGKNAATIVVTIKDGVTIDNPGSTWFVAQSSLGLVFLDSNKSATAGYYSDYDYYSIWFPNDANQKVKLTFEYTTGNGINYISAGATHISSTIFQTGNVDVYSITADGETKLTENTHYTIGNGQGFSYINFNQIYKNSLRLEFTIADIDMIDLQAQCYD